jgi:Ca2+-binding EF-hand superfamily protein
MMRIIDANADGAINDDEAASMADFAFMRMDRDRDGAVSEAEFTQHRGPGGHGGRGGWFRWLAKDEAEAVLKVRKDKFAALDADKNGNLSKTEFFAEAKAKLAAADTDKDGKVTPWEFRASVDPMK